MVQLLWLSNFNMVSLLLLIQELPLDLLLVKYAPKRTERERGWERERERKEEEEEEEGLWYSPFVNEFDFVQHKFLIEKY